MEAGRCGRPIRGETGLESCPDACGVIAWESYPPSELAIRTDFAFRVEDSAAEVPAGVSGGDTNSGALGLNRGDGWPMGLWLCCGVAPGVVSLDAT